MSTSNPQGSAPDPMNDTLGFMKNLWAGVKMPGMTMPSMSVEDINKQIADLKTVESWLALNMNMLRATIQTLEVQCGTLTALQSMGQSVSKSMGSMEQAMEAAMGAAAGNMAQFNPMNAMGGSAPGSWASGGDTSAAAASPPSEPPAPEEPAPAQANPFSFAPPTAEKPPAPETAAPESSAPDGSTESEPASTLASAAAPFVNPAAWWGMLQDQFKQAVEEALEPAAQSAATRKKPVAKTARPARKTGNGRAAKPTRSASKQGTAKGKTTGAKSIKSAKAASARGTSKSRTAAGKKAATGRKRS